VPFGRAFRIPAFCSRRDFLRRTGSGFGMLALSAMLAETAGRDRAGESARGKTSGPPCNS
jgi:hypothetical protein